MRAVPAWVDKVHDRDKVEQCIYDLCFNPEGTRLIVAAGQRVLVYDTHDGSLIQPLKGHKDTVYCVCYAKDGKKFASGSADKSVIIWTSNLEGILKYSHNDALQCLAYNPVTHHLASCAISDFAFWSPEFKAVQKYKSNSRINTCAWTNDGQYLALGLSNGVVSIRNKSGEEKGRIERPNSPQVAIWSVAWNPSVDEDILCVADWGQKISFYTIGGKLIGKERYVGFDPLCVNYISNGEYLLVSGSNRMCTLMTRDGIKLGTIGEPQASWVWCCAARFDSSFVALGCQDGTIAFYQLLFNTVHGLYKERYAFRENMTDVIIQHLLTNEKVRIKCRDLIKKIAIYENRLAVQLPERVVIYELYNNEEQKGMYYRVKEKISRKLDCNLLVVCTNHLVLCQERKLQSLSFNGDLEREWFMDSAIRYIKVVGGTPGQEGLLLGLKNGQVCKIFLDNPFPINLLKIGSAIRCLDQNELMTKLAIVTENSQCLVYDVNNQELLFQEPNANSVAWNSDIDDMLCFSGNNILSIKLSNFPVHQQKLMGFVVGFSGSKVFCLHISTMSAIEVPLSAPMCQYIEKKMFKEAYMIASLGVTQADWETLAFKALEGMNLEIAVLAFGHIKDLRYIDLINDFQNMQHGDRDNELFMGDILAYQGKFREAAQVYKRHKQDDKALNMYTDLRMFDLAQEFLGSVDNADQKALIRKKADWARDINEPKAAAWMYFSAGDIQKAIDIAGENRWVDMLVDIGGRLDKADRPAMELVAKHFRLLGESNHAAEMYHKLGDDKNVVAVYVEAGQWNEAFALAEKNPDLKDLVYAPYALWLAERNEFAEAQRAFHKAGRPEEAFRVLHQLTLNAVEESRLQDAGYYYWVLSRQCLEIANRNKEKKEEMLAKFYEHEKLASIYYAYDFIERYIDEPFLSCLPEGLFNIARYLIHETSGLQLKGISQFFVHYTFAKQGRNLGAFKTTHQVLKKIQSLVIPPEFEDNVGLGLMLNRTKPYNDNEELLPMCYRCSTYNPLWSKTGNSCKVLPLVEFKLEPDISVEEAVSLIQTPATKSTQGESWNQNVNDNYQTLQLDDNIDDPFTTKLMEFENVSESYVPVTVDRATLKAMDPTSVVICRWPEPLEWQFYKNVLPDLLVTICNSCNKMFYIDDFEKQVLQKEHCPFCRCQQADCQTSAVPSHSEFTAL